VVLASFNFFLETYINVLNVFKYIWKYLGINIKQINKNSQAVKWIWIEFGCPILQRTQNTKFHQNPCTAGLQDAFISNPTCPNTVLQKLRAIQMVNINLTYLLLQYLHLIWNVIFKKILAKPVWPQVATWSTNAS
jgi:hypothetical protein